MKSADKKDIILIICPVWGTQKPPLGLAYLATNLNKKGINLKVLDLNIEVYKRVNDKSKELWKFENNKYWCDWDKDFKELLKEEIKYCIKRILSFSNTKIYAFSIQATNRLFSIEVIKRIKKANPNKIIIVGGVGCFDDEEREQIFPLELVDFFVIGEGEVSLFELVDRLKKGLSIENIPGVVYYKNKEKKLALPQLIEPLDRLYFPTYEEFDLKNYTERSLALTMSRGCISRCAFCNDWKMMGKYRTRSAKHMFKEIKYHVEKNNITNFYFNDLLINGNIKELEKLCDLIIKSNYKLAWVALAIPLSSMDYNLMVKMKKAGCITLNYGIESGSDNLLKKIGKPISIKSVEKVLELTRKAGINTQINFIVGFPGETDEDFNKTLEFIRRNRTNICGITNINVCNIVAGSELSINTKKYNILFPNHAKLRDSHWYTLDGNKFEERNRRIKKAINLLENLNIPIWTTNIKEKIIDINKIHHKTKTVNCNKRKILSEIKNLEKKRINVPSKKDKLNENKILLKIRSFLRKSKVDILLVILPPWGTEYPPIGLAYLSTYLKSKGIITQIIDVNIDFFYFANNELKKLWYMSMTSNWCLPEKFQVLEKQFNDMINRYVNKISKTNAKIICFSVNSANILMTKEFIKRLRKKTSSQIVVGGPSIGNKKSRKHFYDLVNYFIIGEGEETLYKLYNNLSNGKINIIPGVIKVHRGIESDYIPKKPLDINSIPFPTYDEFDFSKYKMDQLPFLLSKGCIRKCLFCNDSTSYQKFNHRDPKQIFDEIYHHYTKYNIKCFESHDLLINGDLIKLEEFCDLLIQSEINIEWHGQAIIRDMSISLLRKMRKSGLKSLVLGLDSASDVVLKKMGKPYTAKSAEDMVIKAKREGINIYINIIIGMPGEEEKDFIKTMEFLGKNKENISAITSLNICMLFKDTNLYKFRDKFNITIEREGEDSEFWYDNKGNTFKLRKNRMFRILKFLKKINLPVAQSNQFLEEFIPKNIIKVKIEKKRINVNYKKNKMIRRTVEKFLKIGNVFRGKKYINKVEQIIKKLVPIPKYVTIDLTNSCNLNCVGCWTHSPLLKDKEASKEWKSQMIPSDKLRKVINDLYDLGTERIRLTGGGEPFLYPKITEVIRLIKEKGMACDITTNFVLLTKEKIKQLFELNVDEIVVSIWAGDAETYVKTHPNQTKETFERIRDNLEFIAQYKEKVRKGPKVIMANVISNINYNKIEEMAKFATHVSLDELYFTLIDPIKDRTDCMLLNDKERKILLKKLKNVKKIVEVYNKKSKIHKIRIDDINRFIGKVKCKKANEGEYELCVLNKPCYIGWIFSRILANGDVVPCCRAVMYSMGNINKQSFKDIWFSDEYDKFRGRALYENKLSPYFKRIGCFMTCDNQVHNREIEKKNL